PGDGHRDRSEGNDGNQAPARRRPCQAYGAAPGKTAARHGAQLLSVGKGRQGIRHCRSCHGHPQEGLRHGRSRHQRPEKMRLPLLAVRDVVIFPHMSLPLSVGREKSIKALETSMQDYNKRVLVVAQKQAQTEDHALTDLYTVGVVADVVQFLRMPDGTLKVFLQGLTRARSLEPDFVEAKGCWTAEAEDIAEP